MSKLTSYIKTKHEERQKFVQYTKRVVTAMLIMSFIWITWSYIMSTIALIRYQDVNPLISLSEKVCEVILGSIVGYFAKALVENFLEKTITPYLLKDKKDEKNEEVLG